MAAPVMPGHDPSSKTYHQTMMIQSPKAKRWDPTILESVAPDDVQFVYDIDLDALTVQFRGRAHPSIVDPLNEDFAQLLDLRTREIVGFELRCFRSKWLQVQPSLVAVLRVATIVGLADEGIEDEIDERGSDLLRPLVGWWRDRRQRSAKRAALHLLSMTSGD